MFHGVAVSIAWPFFTQKKYIFITPIINNHYGKEDESLGILSRYP